MTAAGELRVEVLGVGLLGPGLADWAQGRALLREAGAWRDGPTPAAAPQRLAPAERRRAGAPVRLSLVVAEEAVARAGLAPAGLTTVFTSSSGDTQNCHALCEALAQPERVVSPTRFTNSVHNAAAGYWHIATASRAPSTSLCAFDASFGAGLLEAATQAVALDRPVLLVAADVPYPAPLHATRPLPAGFAVALVLAPAARPGDEAAGHGAVPAAASAASTVGATAGAAADDRARLTLRLEPLADGLAPTPCAEAGLEALRATVPAARALPLLQALARGQAEALRIEAYPGLALRLQLVGADAV